MFDAIGFDADDTLWHNERLFSMTQKKFRGILKEHAPDLVDRQLLDTEKKNLQVFGYGIKGFVLSMIETSIQLTKGEISGNEIEQIMDFGREMLTAPIQLLEHVEDALQQLQNNYILLLITKGDLIDQETKIVLSTGQDTTCHKSTGGDPSPVGPPKVNLTVPSVLGAYYTDVRGTELRYVGLVSAGASLFLRPVPDLLK